MARHTIYMTPATEMKIKNRIQAMRNDGAIGNDSTMSGFGGKLLELGLRVYENQQDRESNPIEAMDVNRQLLKESILIRHMLEANYRTMLKLPDVRKELTISPSDMLVAIRAKADKEFAELYEAED